MRRRRRAIDEGLSLVDLVACALSSLLLMVFAALATRGGLGGSSAGFALVTYEWEFADDASKMEAEVRLDSQLLFRWGSHGFAPPSDVFRDQAPAGGGWSTVPGADPFYTVFAEAPDLQTRRWPVRIMARSADSAIAYQCSWNFTGPARPTLVRIALLDQTTEGRRVERSLALPANGPLAMTARVDLGTLQVSTGTR